MDSNIIVAIIGAVATIVAALIAFLAVMISREKKKQEPDKSSRTAVNKQKAKASRGSTVIQIGGAKSE